MSVEIKTVSQIELDLGINNGGAVQKYITKTAEMFMYPYVPYRDGFLRDNTRIEDEYVEYQSPYAGYQYYGIRKDGTHKVEQYTTAGTGTRWDEKMMSIDKVNFLDDIQNYVEGKK